jgi:hypothetical protein
MRTLLGNALRHDAAMAAGSVEVWCWSSGASAG